MIENNNISKNELSDYEQEKLYKKLKLVRDEFKTVGKYGMPLIKKQDIDLDKINLWNYTKTKNNDDEHKDKTIHFFTYDWPKKIGTYLEINVMNEQIINVQFADMQLMTLTPTKFGILI